MAYFLGRDVAVYITTESTGSDESININQAMSGKCTAGAAAAAGLLFAREMVSGATSSHSAVADLTGVDVSIGATDEDITYIGQKGTAKVEIKKEMTVSLTRKKKNNLWDTIFNGPTASGSLTNYSTDQTFGARWGLDGSGAKIGDGLSNPKDVGPSGGTTVEYGYRIHVQLNPSATAGEIMAFPNCTINSYSTSLNVDGTTEETMEFGTQQGVVYGADGETLNTTLTTAANY
tara:strand:- start:33 stop:731 length:699 start_codon:yes stop_codon:yes gene_type:complete